MARSLTGEIDEQLDLNNVVPILLLELTLASETVRCWSGTGNLSIMGNTWIGTGELGTISQIEEASATEAIGTSVELSSVDSSLLSDALTEVRVGRPATIYLGFLKNVNGVFSPVSDPMVLFKGYVDTPSINADPSPNAGSIKIALESKMLDLQRVAPVRWTSEHQHRWYGNDTGMDYIAGLQDSNNRWGY